MKKKIWNNDGPFPSWRYETAEETLAREINHYRFVESKPELPAEKIVKAAELFMALNRG